MDAARRKYRQFHGTNPGQFVEVEVPPGTPPVLVALGELEALAYDARRLPTRTKDEAIYEHTFGDFGDGGEIVDARPILATDVHGEHFFIIRGPSGFRVADWIEG